MSPTDKLSIVCDNCGTSGEAVTTDFSYQCSVCEVNYEATRCGECGDTYLTDAPAWSTSQCPKCAFVQKRRTAAESTFGEIKGPLTAPSPSSAAPSSATQPKPRARPQVPSGTKKPTRATHSSGLPSRPVVKAHGAEVEASSAARPRRSRLDPAKDRLHRRIGPVIVSGAFVVLGLAYLFRWGSVVSHVPSLWLGPGDLRFTYFAASQLAHGHFGAIYNRNLDFVDFPGMLIALAPLGALSNVFRTTLVEVTKTQSIPVPFSIHYVIPFLNPQEFHHAGGNVYVSHPQWVVAVDPYVLLLSCAVLFACDALAERLKVSKPRRVVILVVEAVLLWNVTILYGHPEDAVAVALGVYALISAMDRRFTKAGWLFGAAVAFQPLVLLMLPVLLAMAGRRGGIGVAIRCVLPSALLLAAPLIANFRVTFKELVDQPSFPNLDHTTPWTAWAPNLGGHGENLAVAAGPVRLLAIPVVIGLGIWVARRGRLERIELLAFVCAVALAFRSYTESVMVAYYPAAAMAIGVVVAARCTRWRFVIAVSLAVATTIFAQMSLAWIPWWIIQMTGLTGVLVVSARTKSIPLATDKVDRLRDRLVTGMPRGSWLWTVRTSASRSAQPPRRARGLAGRSEPTRTKRKAPPPAAKRSGRR